MFRYFTDDAHTFGFVLYAGPGMNMISSLSIWFIPGMCPD